MFIRTKLINNQRYAYLVENIWQGKTKQKVKKYLGKVFSFEPLSEDDFLRYFNIMNIEDYISKTDFSDIIKNLVEFELIRYGFIRMRNADFGFGIEKNNSKIQNLKSKIERVIFINDKVFFDIDAQKAYVKRKNAQKEVVIAINEGFLCNETINNLVNFKVDKELDEKNLGYKLARAFVDAGLNVPEELFVRVFEKMVVSC